MLPMNEMVFYDENVSYVCPGQAFEPGLPPSDSFNVTEPVLEDGASANELKESSPTDLLQYSCLFNSESHDAFPRDYLWGNVNASAQSNEAELWSEGQTLQIFSPQEDVANLWKMMDKSQLRFLPYFDYGEIIRELHIFKLGHPQMPIDGFLEFAEANAELLFNLGKKSFFITLNYGEFLNRHRAVDTFTISTIELPPSATSGVSLGKLELGDSSSTPSEPSLSPNDVESEGTLLPWQAPLAGWGSEKVSERIQLILDKEWEVGLAKHSSKIRTIRRKKPNNKVDWRPVTLASAMGVTSRGPPILESLVGQLNMRAQRAWKRRSADAIAKDKKISTSIVVRQTGNCTRKRRFKREL